MNFLKKLVGYFAKAGAIATDIAVGFPLLQPLLGSGKASRIGNIVANDLTSIGSVLVQTETILGAAPGVDRMAAAMKLIPQLIATSQLVDGHKIADEVKFNQGCQEITQGVYDVLASLKTDKVPG